jgi:hypothetical protein
MGHDRIARGEAQSPDGWTDLHALVTDRLSQVNSASTSLSFFTEIVDALDRSEQDIRWDAELPTELLIPWDAGLAIELLEKARVDIDDAAFRR